MPISRQDANRQIILHIQQLVEQYPDLRFHQVLHALGIVETDTTGFVKDLFYEESTVTLTRIEKKMP